MRRFFSFTIFFLALTSAIKAQNSGVSFELHYPLVFADEYNYTDDVNGLLGGAVGFQFSDNIDFNYGIKYRFDQLLFNQNSRYSNSVKRQNFMTHHINGFGTYNLTPSGIFKGVLEVGVSFYKYRNSNYQPSYFGFNVSPGVQAEFQNQFYALANYSYVKATLKQKQTGFVEHESMHVIRLGIGFKL